MARPPSKAESRIEAIVRTMSDAGSYDENAELDALAAIYTLQMHFDYLLNHKALRYRSEISAFSTGVGIAPEFVLEEKLHLPGFILRALLAGLVVLGQVERRLIRSAFDHLFWGEVPISKNSSILCSITSPEDSLARGGPDCYCVTVHHRHWLDGTEDKLEFDWEQLLLSEIGAIYAYNKIGWPTYSLTAAGLERLRTRPKSTVPRKRGRPKGSGDTDRDYDERVIEMYRMSGARSKEEKLRDVQERFPEIESVKQLDRILDRARKRSKRDGHN